LAWLSITAAAWGERERNVTAAALAFVRTSNA
jgi:hypothetical protein